MAARVVYLSASSGGGHDGVARALMDLGKAVLGPELEQERVDVYGGGPLTALPVMSRLRYRSAPLWKAFFSSTDSRAVSRLLATSLRPLALRKLRQLVPGAPELLVAVHFGTAQYVNRLAAALPVRPLTAVVVTDYQPHWAWFAPADLYVVPSAEAEARALLSGLRREQIVRVKLLPCQLPAVASRRAAQAGPLRVLAAAGADGSSEGRLAAVLRLLDQRPAAQGVQVQVVCGRSESLLQRMRALSATLRRLALDPVGFVPDLPDRFAAADLSLLRASPQTLTESLAAGTPVVAFDWLTHEAGNAALLAQLECGVATRSPPEAAAHLCRLLEDRGALRSLQAAAQRAAALAPGGDFAQRFFAPLRRAALARAS